MWVTEAWVELSGRSIITRAASAGLLVPLWEHCAVGLPEAGWASLGQKSTFYPGLILFLEISDKHLNSVF